MGRVLRLRQPSAQHIEQGPAASPSGLRDSSWCHLECITSCDKASKKMSAVCSGTTESNECLPAVIQSSTVRQRRGDPIQQTTTRWPPLRAESVCLQKSLERLFFRSFQQPPVGRGWCNQELHRSAQAFGPHAINARVRFSNSR